jgi:hypothetical protein
MAIERGAHPRSPYSGDQMILVALTAAHTESREEAAALRPRAPYFSVNPTMPML